MNGPLVIIMLRSCNDLFIHIDLIAVSVSRTRSTYRSSPISLIRKRLAADVIFCVFDKLNSYKRGQNFPNLIFILAMRF